MAFPWACTESKGVVSEARKNEGRNGIWRTWTTVQWVEFERTNKFDTGKFDT
jgi:hypothetical protein